MTTKQISTACYIIACAIFVVAVFGLIEGPIVAAGLAVMALGLVFGSV